MSLDMTIQKWVNFYNGGLWENLCRINLKLFSWLYNKRWHASWKFQLEISSKKKVIAKKALTNLYEMNCKNQEQIKYMTVKTKLRFMKYSVDKTVLLADLPNWLCITEPKSLERENEDSNLMHSAQPALCLEFTMTDERPRSDSSRSLYVHVHEDQSKNKY